MLYYTVTTRKLFYDSRPYFIILHYTMSYDIIIIIVIISIIIIIYIYIYIGVYIYIYIYIYATPLKTYLEASSCT